MASNGNFVVPKNATKIIINFGEICRFCLSETQNDISLKDKCLPEESSQIEQDTIYSFVTKLKIIKMNNIEDYPSLVCKNCHEVIKICYNFIKVCQKSEDLLNGCFEKAVKETSDKLNLINVIPEPPEKNLDLNVEVNYETEEKSEEISKAQEMGIKKDIVLFPDGNEFPSAVSVPPVRNCSLCPLKFSNAETLNLHYISTHERKYEKMVTEQSQTDVKNMKDFFHFYCPPFKEFQTREGLLEHINSHEVRGCYDCSYCESGFSSKLKLGQHMVEFHNVDAVSWEDVKLPKEECNDGISQSKNSDVLINQEKRLVSCTNSNPPVEFLTRDNLIKHVREQDPSEEFENETGMENKSKWKCPDCPAAYSQKQSLFSHMHQKHNKEYPESMKCPVCAEMFLTNRKLIQHGIAAHQTYFAHFHKIFKNIIQPQCEKQKSKNFECDMCQKRYIFKTSLKKHIFSAHLGEQKGSATCPHCGKILASKLNLKSHIEFIHEALFVSCPICRKKINFRTIGRHYKVHQNNPEHLKNSFLCTQCGKILKSRRSFEDHQKLHKNIRNELCDVCGSGYATKKALRLHKKTHEGGRRKSHGCDQCEKVFNGRHTLNRHLLTHSGVKNFICEICSKCFYTLQELNRHVRYHKKEYRFECHQCDMRFVDRSRFRHHLMKHKNIRPHKCEFCGKMFIVRGKMNLHMAAKHNVQVDSSRVWKDPKAYIPLDDLL